MSSQEMSIFPRYEMTEGNEEKDYISDSIVKSIYSHAEKISNDVVTYPSNTVNWDRKIDNVLTSRIWGFPIMLALLGLVFWITITGANYPSSLLANALFGIEEQLSSVLVNLNSPDWLIGFLVFGVYRGTAWVVSVMLPPMAIFFPLFTLLEDVGYLPRVAFNLDKFFKKAGAHGKQALTMCMGFGCNAAGIVSCRIIDSPRERMLAILTNNFVPCNGRFPTLIVLATIFIGGSVAFTLRSAVATLAVSILIIMGIVITLIVSWILSKTLLKGVPSSFILELPPYRKPKFGEVIIRSILDRTIFILGRAVIIAAPAGGLIWILANTSLGDTSILLAVAAFLNGFASWMGIDGFILLAFILGLPANEIVIPVLIMSYISGSAMTELDSLVDLRNLLVIEHGWTWLTALCTMVFCLCHWPCGTTLYTIQKEQHSWKWTGMAFLIPTLAGIILCMLINFTAHGLGLI